MDKTFVEKVAEVIKSHTVTSFKFRDLRECFSDDIDQAAAEIAKMVEEMLPSYDCVKDIHRGETCYANGVKDTLNIITRRLKGGV